MNALGQFHLATSLLAVATGAWVVLRPKGTVSHRRFGWLYSASMIALNGSALWIYRLTGGFGPFHVAAVFSLATLLVGVSAAWRRKPGDRSWLPRHYYFMSWSYVGLLAALVAEVATRIPAIQEFAGGPTIAFWVTVALVSVAVFVAGGWMIRRRADALLRRFQHA
jgi:uncharacterized membrane protein